MAISVQTTLDDRIAKYISLLQVQQHITEAAVVRELIEIGYEQILRDLHRRYQLGELTFRTVAAELGVSVRELYDLFERRNLAI